MTRKLLLLGIVAFVACGAVVDRSGAADKPGDKAAPAYVHAVVFTLKKEAPADEVESLLTDCHEVLEKISTVRYLSAGRPAEKATPKVARKDYSVGLVILFDDADGLQKYLDDPLHLKFVAKHGKYFDEEKLAVFDFVNQPK